MAINYTQPSFNTGTVLDPTRNALAAVTTARQSLSDMLDRNMKQNALQQAKARQKVLDDRATAEYNNKVNERNALGKFEQGILAPRQTYYGDVNNSKAMKYAKNVELTGPELALQKQGKTTPEIEAKLKAQENFGNMITNNGAGYKETEWQKAQRVAREQGVGDSLAVAQRLYSIKAADVAARDKKETDALKQKNDLLTRYNKVNDDIANLQIAKKKYVKGSSGKSLWTADDVANIEDLANRFTSSLYPGQGDSGLVKKLMTYAQTKNVGPKTFSNILIPGGLGGENNYLTNEKLRIPTKKDATDEEVANYYRAKIDAAAANNVSSGTKGKNGFYYNTEDTSTALKLKRAQAAQLKAQIEAIRTDYTDDGRTAQEHSMDKINSLAEQYWSQPITGTTDKSGSKSGSSTGTTGKSAKEVISGAIGKAINTKGKGGELAKLVTDNPVQFGKEYDVLGTEGKAKVDKILQSDASKKYFNELDVTGKKDKVEPAKKMTKDDLKSLLVKEYDNDPNTSNSLGKMAKFLSGDETPLVPTDKTKLHIMKGLEKAGYKTLEDYKILLNTLPKDSSEYKAVQSAYHYKGMRQSEEYRKQDRENQLHNALNVGARALEYAATVPSSIGALNYMSKREINNIITKNIDNLSNMTPSQFDTIVKATKKFGNKEALRKLKEFIQNNPIKGNISDYKGLHF